jgi:hypothetical protein
VSFTKATICLKPTLSAGTILARRHSGDQPKSPGKVRLIRKPCFESDVGDGRIGMGEFFASCLNAEFANKLPHTAPVVPLKLTSQMNRMYSGASC